MEERIRRVLDHIEAHLGDDLSLADLASVGCLSPYHFSRIFTWHVGSSPMAYLRKARVERAGVLLATGDLPVQRVAEAVGFATLSAFNQAFKAHQGCSPRAYRKQAVSKEPSENRKDEGVPPAPGAYPLPISDFLRRILAMNLKDVLLPDLEVAYLSQTGSYLDTGPLWGRLLGWTGPRGLVPPACPFFGISYDEPEAADEAKTTDVCVVLPPGFDRTDRTVGYKTVKGGRFLVYEFYDRVDRLALVYRQVVTEYLPGSPDDLDDRDFLEFVMNDPASDPEGKVRVNLHIPVKGK